MNWIDAEIERARTEGVQHPENLPFLLVPDQPNGQAVVLIHGFGATPHSIFPVAAALCTQGYRVAGIRLPGHGTSPEDLKERKAEEWLDSARSAYDALAADGLQISAGGLSTGALIALTLAAERPPHKLLLFSPFLRLRHHLAPIANLLSPFMKYQKRVIADSEKDFYYGRRPLQAVGEINRLLRNMPRILPHISAPTLILTSTGDTTIARGTAFNLYQRLGTPHKIIHTYGNEVPHVLTTRENPLFEDVLERCLEFMGRDFSRRD